MKNSSLKRFLFSTILIFGVAAGGLLSCGKKELLAVRKKVYPQQVSINGEIDGSVSRFDLLSNTYFYRKDLGNGEMIRILAERMEETSEEAGNDDYYLVKIYDEKKNDLLQELQIHSFEKKDRRFDLRILMQTGISILQWWIITLGIIEQNIIIFSAPQKENL